MRKAKSLFHSANHAINYCARAIAKNAVKEQMRARGIRLTLVPARETNERASAYLAAHPELYQLALERARRMGIPWPLSRNAVQAFARCDAWADTTTAAGTLMLTVLAGLAEYERHLFTVAQPKDELAPRRTVSVSDASQACQPISGLRRCAVVQLAKRSLQSPGCLV